MFLKQTHALFPMQQKVSTQLFTATTLSLGNFSISMHRKGQEKPGIMWIVHGTMLTFLLRRGYEEGSRENGGPMADSRPTEIFSALSVILSILL